ncbi:MAG: fibronectin type III domain-containing protein, partial [Candidatus Delongbacteria bacterium]|nr:fibronectin type III domain-containing protein [Candidatus Delongbacteria bacterium]
MKKLLLVVLFCAVLAVFAQTPPSAPVAASASDITVSGFTANWNASTGADGYRIDIDINNDFSNPFVSDLDVGNLTFFELGQLGISTQYFYRVRAYNSNGTSSNSNIINVFTNAELLPATPTVNSTGTGDYTSIHISWQHSDYAHGYNLFLSGTGTNYEIDAGYVNEYTIDSLLSATIFNVTVQAYNNLGESGWSSPITANTVIYPPVIKAETNITKNSFYINWDSSYNAHYYEVSWNQDNINVGQLNVVGNSLKIENLFSGIECQYQVAAVNPDLGTVDGYGCSSIYYVIILPEITAKNPTGIAYTSFTANWNVSTGATGYRIDVDDNNDFLSPLTGYSDLDVGNVFSYSISGLSSGTTYYYRVRAYNASGTSENSNVIGTITIPAAPVANSASEITASGFTANWGSVTGADGYRMDVVEYWESSSTAPVIRYDDLDVGNVTSKVLTDLPAGFRFTYIIRAYNASGTSENSNLIETFTIPYAPLPYPAEYLEIFTNSFTAVWWNSDPFVTGSRLDVDDNSDFSSPLTGYNDLDVGNVVNLTVTGLECGTKYYWRVRSYNASGTSESSDVVEIMTLLSAPVATSASEITASGFTANWGSVTGAAGYRIDVDDNSDFSSLLTGYNDLDVGNVVNLTVTDLWGGCNCYYRIRAYNASGTSENSNVIETITKPPVPCVYDIPDYLYITTNSFKAQWDNFFYLGVEGFRIDVDDNSDFSSPLTGYNDLDAGRVDNVTVTGLESGTKYYWRVRSYNASGTSESSNVVETITHPSAPEATLASGITISGFTANWNSVNGADGYRIDIDDNIDFSSPLTGYSDLDVGNVTTKAVTGLSSGVTYYYRVRAYNMILINAGGESYLVLSGYSAY